MRTLLIISFIFFTAFTSAQTVSAKAELSVLSYDFGKVKPGEKLKYELFVKNTGKIPVEIRKVIIDKSDIISAEWWKGPIMPGKEKLITLTISIPAYHRGFSTSAIKVFYNNDNSGPLIFMLNFNVSE